MKHLITLIILTAACISSSAQTQLKGTVIDRISEKPVPYAGIGFWRTTTGTITDDNGNFFLETHRPGIDSIIIQSLGYEPDTFQIETGVFNEAVFEITPKSYDIDEIIITPGENPAHVLLRKVIKAKPYNDPAELDTYSFQAYTKMQLDLNNFDPGIGQTAFMRNFSIAFEGVDTAANGKIYMPIFITENISNFYYQKRPKRQKEYIKAANIAGVENPSAARYTGGMYTEINFYENYMNLFEKQFVSPIAFNGLLVYKYYLSDSAYIDDVYCRQITFRPRRKHEYTFEGSFWVADQTHALKKIHARVSNTANIEYVQELIIDQDFAKVNDSLFFMNKEHFFTDLNIAEQTAGFFARKTSMRKNIKINPELPNDIFSPGYAREIELNEDARNRSKAYWDSMRHIPLSEKEQNIFIMTDSVQNIKAFQSMKKIMTTAFTGYYPGKYIEPGPIFESYTFNEIEGTRLQAGMRTSNKFSERVELSGHLAFGFKDQKFKYGSMLKYKIQDIPWTLARITYNHDMIPLGRSFMNYSDDLFSSALRRTPNDNLLFQKNLTADIERDIVRGIFVKAFINHTVIYPSETMPFVLHNDAPLEHITGFEAGITAHIGFNEEYVEAVFNRISLGSVFPITEISYTAGMPGIWGSQYRYSKINFFLTHRFYLGPVGKFDYNIEAGKIFGKVSFPFLKLFNGNESYILYPQAFNLMNVYEFAADEYVSVFLEHHFQGLFLNKIPLMRRLKWREVVFFRGATGRLSESNRNELQFPGFLNSVEKPYMEAGAGVENIFKFFRIDTVWRLSHLDNENAPNFGIRVGMYASF